MNEKNPKRKIDWMLMTGIFLVIASLFTNDFGQGFLLGSGLMIIAFNLGLRNTTRRKKKDLK